MKKADFIKAIAKQAGTSQKEADAVLAASLFHFGEIKISDLKDYLEGEGIPVRRVL